MSMVRDAVPVLRAADGGTGRSRVPRASSAHVLFSDGSWRTCRVTGWTQNARGEWVVLIWWPDGRSDWRVYDSRYIHAA